MLCAGFPFGTIKRRLGVWILRKLRIVLKPELNSKDGPLWKRFPGDRNREKFGLRKGTGTPGFFHRMANAHRRRNCLNSICINARKLDKEEDIKEGLVDAFQNLLSAPGGWSPPLPDLILNRIGIEEAASLEESFSENEIWTAISGLNRDKAPGHDGFPLAFWAFCLDFVKFEVIGFFKEFHDNARFVKNLNTTFLVLIPKKQSVEDFKD